jgi:hypothetical protein
VNPGVGPLTVSSSSASANGGSAFAQGEAEYYLELTGPTVVNGMIPVLVDIKVHVDVLLSDPFVSRDLGSTGDLWASGIAHAGIEFFKPVADSSQQVLASESVFSPAAIFPTEVTASAGDRWCFEKICVPSGIPIHTRRIYPAPRAAA